MAEREFDRLLAQGLASKRALQGAQTNLAQEQADIIRPEFGLEKAKFRDKAAFDRQKLFLENAGANDGNRGAALGSVFEGFSDSTYNPYAVNVQPPSFGPRRSALNTYERVGNSFGSRFMEDEAAFEGIGLANGGVVPPAGYPAYVKAMAGKTAMSPQQYAQVAGGILAKRAADQAAARNAGQTQLYAKGGMVTPELEDVGGAMLEGPGHGKSDSIPAMIDGQQPAALSKGEFVIPRHVVEYFGTKHFDQLVEKARMAGKKKAKKGAI